MSGLPDPYSSAIGEFVIGLSAIGGAPPLPGIPNTILAYLYFEYSDDDDLQAFIDAYNTLTQQYVNWFNYVILPDYTNQYIVGPLLDWVGEGLYGIARPVLPSGMVQQIGAYNTWAYNTEAYNGSKLIEPNTYYTDDDVYKRVLTWHLFKADGKYFTIPWLKRRVLRFLLGANGVNVDVSNTQRISVTFGSDYAVTIRLVTVIGSISSGATYNTMAYNAFYYNEYHIATVTLPQFAFGPQLQAAVAAGVLELPFQFSWTVQLT